MLRGPGARCRRPDRSLPTPPPKASGLPSRSGESDHAAVVCHERCEPGPAVVLSEGGPRCCAAMAYPMPLVESWTGSRSDRAMPAPCHALLKSDRALTWEDISASICPAGLGAPRPASAASARASDHRHRLMVGQPLRPCQPSIARDADGAATSPQQRSVTATTCAHSWPAANPPPSLRSILVACWSSGTPPSATRQCRQTAALAPRSPRPSPADHRLQTRTHGVRPIT